MCLCNHKTNVYKPKIIENSKEQSISRDRAMSSTVYAPVSKTGREGGDKALVQREVEITVPENGDTDCGFFCVSSPALKPCANISVFTAFYSLAALVTSTLSVYVNSQITTLERQFGFSSQQTGVIMAANDIGYLVCVLFVSYSASKMHIPRSLGVAVVIFGLSGLACSLPHFIFGTSGIGDASMGAGNISLGAVVTSLGAGNWTKPAEIGPRKSSMFGDLCDSLNSSQGTCATVTAHTKAYTSPEVVSKTSFIIIVIGMMLQGFGKAPRASLTLTYLDDNTARVNTGFYMGIIATVGILGPAVAYLMGGLFSKMYVTLQPTKLTPRHPKWIGAWWLGYVLFGVLALVVAVPVFCFPRKMPAKGSRKDSRKDSINDSFDEKRKDLATDKIDAALIEKPVEGDANTRSEKHHLNQTRASVITKLNPNFLLRHSREFVATLFRLWTNPVYISIVVSGCFLIFTVGGSSAYVPKYLERMFNLPTHMANYIIAGQTLCTSCIGTFIGGYLTKRMKMTAMGAMKFVILVISISLIAHFMGFVFHCDQPEVLNWPSQANNCSGACNCRDNSYFPVCGGDARTYYSPCMAGCQLVDNGVYQNCSCIPGGDATPGLCDYSCPSLYAYVLFMGLRSLFGTLSIIPKMVLFIRCVAHKDRPLAIGFSSFVMSLLGWMLGPIVFGFIIDDVCQVWDISCQVRGRCLRYDNSMFRLKLHSYGGVGLSLSMLCTVLAYVYAWWTKCLDEVDGQKDEGTTADMLLIGTKSMNIQVDTDQKTDMGNRKQENVDKV